MASFNYNVGFDINFLADVDFYVMTVYESFRNLVNFDGYQLCIDSIRPIIGETRTRNVVINVKVL